MSWRRWWWRVRSIHLVLCLLVCVVVFLLLSFRVGDDPKLSNVAAPARVKSDILELSQLYLKRLASEQEGIDTDGPYSGHETAYDLKKTLAVLLESLMQRVNRLERQLLPSALFGSRDVNRSSMVSAADLLAGKQEDCGLPAESEWGAAFPDCGGKLQWMESFWQSDACYAAYGVDGSRCSMFIYLGEVERHCPPLPHRPPVGPVARHVPFADAQLHVDGLFALMKDTPANFVWIKERIGRMWPKWRDAYHYLAAKQNWTLQARHRKRIVLHLGLLTQESGFKFGEKSLSGGPLGELVQWSDLLASLYILGHQLIISSEMRTFMSYAQADKALKSSCPVTGAAHVDIIYTDIVGLRQMKRKLPGSLQNYKCRLRVLDSFGTQAEFNDNGYFQKNKARLGGNGKNVWGGHRLNLQQFFTMFPHSPDNSFLGFVVEIHGNATAASDIADAAAEQRENVSLVYGKQVYMMKGAETYLKLVSRITPVHATMQDDKGALPQFVRNHGVLNGDQFHSLLRRVKVFLGLGFPYEGPAPLEAIANGAVFINPRFAKPKGRLTEKFFSEKPTLRELSSQNPYAEQMLGAPYVQTVDMEDARAVEEAVRSALATDLRPHLPFEFTAAGLLERVNAFTQQQDFCAAVRNWPPFAAVRLFASQTGQSCQHACGQQGLVCEPSYFPKLNNTQVFKSLFGQCPSVERVADVYAPAVSVAGACFLQDSELLYSCSAAADGYRRVCGCRDFIRDQVALCAACL